MTGQPPASDLPTSSTAQPTQSPESIERQLLAHRQVLALLITELRRLNGAPDLTTALDRLSIMQDHQEDPGAVVDGAVAIQGTLAGEVRLIVRSCAALP